MYKILSFIHENPISWRRQFFFFKRIRYLDSATFKVLYTAMKMNHRRMRLFCWFCGFYTRFTPLKRTTKKIILMMLVFETNSYQLSQGLADPENPFNLHISINTRKAYIFSWKKPRCPTTTYHNFLFCRVHYQNVMPNVPMWNDSVFNAKQRAILILLQDMSMSNPSLNHTEKNEMSKNVIFKTRERKERNMSRQRKNVFYCNFKEEEG